MFEMFLTVVATVVASLYGLSQSVFMNGPYKHYYRLGALGLIVLIWIIHKYYTILRDAHIRDLKVDVQDYLYYHKFTAILYRAGYFLSYFIQNLLFDYTYMKRNFNFCKGLDVYDGGVGDYYIKFRNTWYSYMKLCLTRHRVSLKKLQAYAQNAKNEMILYALKGTETYYIYMIYRKEAMAYYEEHHFMNKPLLKSFSNYKIIDKYFSKNLWKYYKAVMYIQKHEPLIKELVNRQQQRSHSDVNDFKKLDYR